MPISKEFIQETIDFWSPRYGYRISEEDALEIISNVKNYFKWLVDADREERKREHTINGR
ncbi:MAG: hypothetical protein KKH94_12355 [Candidatus Omnitrophica bacterium]|nr:hypothetical protein [bacterium]MBU1864444.1 hypothetical protein [Candidatus Omnitrophota bacterium]